MPIVTSLSVVLEIPHFPLQTAPCIQFKSVAHVTPEILTIINNVSLTIPVMYNQTMNTKQGTTTLSLFRIARVTLPGACPVTLRCDCYHNACLPPLPCMQSFIQVQLCHPLSAFPLPACSCISFLTIVTFISSDRRFFLFLSGSRFTSLGPCYVDDLNRTTHTMGAIGNKCAKHRLHLKPMKEDLLRPILRSVITSKRHTHL